jgi:exonuclease VII small subunit
MQLGDMIFELICSCLAASRQPTEERKQEIKRLVSALNNMEYDLDDDTQAILSELEETVKGVTEDVGTSDNENQEAVRSRRKKR